MSFKYKSIAPRLWKGRYARIPGGEAAFHVALQDGWEVVVYWNQPGCTASCRARPRDESQTLADGVNRAKLSLGGSHGGSFLINEFGQVLVPAQDGSGRVALAGIVEGRLTFENPYGGALDIADDSGLRAGSAWERPYVGIPHNLHSWSRIYFWREGPDGGRSEYAPVQDDKLISSLRAIRPSGAVRFIVNPHGIVLTKHPPSWAPVYVGRIDPRKWFSKEEGA